jgi:hypothetical protein
MTFDEQKLYELLPSIYRIRDAEQSVDASQSPPLKALLSIIAEQANVLEENLAQLYDDQFVETCAPWVLAYLGDLIGIKGLPGAGLEALNPRAEVAHTIGYRRRKGTAAMLEQLARDITNWPARAVEFFQLLATNQYLNHVRPENLSFISVRDAERLEYLDGAFEHSTAGEKDLTHTVDVRRIASRRGRYNIPNVGIFLWRLRAFPLTSSPAVPATGSQSRFFFNPLGCNSPLFNSPETEEQVTHLAEPINVADRIRRRLLRRSFQDYYGKDKSLLLERVTAPNTKPVSIPAAEIVVCDLSDWINLPTSKIAIDPVLGRIAFPSDEPRPPLVTFHYGFSAPMGGGEYNRLSAFDTRQTQVLDDQGEPIIKRVSHTLDSSATIAAALTHPDLNPRGGTVEILDSGRYEENLNINATGKTVVLRAADKHRPTLVLGAELKISGGKDDAVIIDGLMISGAGIKVTGKLGRLQLRHCTLVPGIALDNDGKPLKPKTPSLVIESENTRVEIDHSIVGAVVAGLDVEVTIQNSIVDATSQTNLAYAGPAKFGGPLHITNSTIIGQVRTTIMRLASNTIFMARVEEEAKEPTAPVQAERRQEGCVRFSYLSPGAAVPFRFHCQPESDGSLVRPRFVSTRFNDPGYCQLSATCPCEIRCGADDESSMGAFHDLFEPRREAHLRTRLDEYLRFGLEAGIFYVT